MDNNDLDRINSNIKEKLGAEEYAKISDSIGELITGNTLNLDEIKSKEEQITKLQESNKQLIMANGNLLKQVPMGRDEPQQNVDGEQHEKLKITDIINENGEII